MDVKKGIVDLVPRERNSPDFFGVTTKITTDTYLYGIKYIRSTKSDIICGTVTCRTMYVETRELGNKGILLKGLHVNDPVSPRDDLLRTMITGLHPPEFKMSLTSLGDGT